MGKTHPTPRRYYRGMGARRSQGSSVCPGARDRAATARKCCRPAIWPSDCAHSTIGPAAVRRIWHPTDLTDLTDRTDAMRRPAPPSSARAVAQKSGFTGSVQVLTDVIPVPCDGPFVEVFVVPGTSEIVLNCLDGLDHVRGQSVPTLASDSPGKIQRQVMQMDDWRRDRSDRTREARHGDRWHGCRFRDDSGWTVFARCGRRLSDRGCGVAS